MTASTIITILVFLFMVISFTMNKIPMAATAMLGAMILLLTHCVEPSAILNNFGSSTVLTMGSMFVVAGGLARTTLVPKLSKLLSRVSGSSLSVAIIGYVLITFILGQFIPSTTALFALVLPLALAMCKELNFNRAALIYPIALTCVSASYAITPIGPYVSNFVENNGLLAEYGIAGFENTVFTEMTIKLPVAIAVVLWAIFVIPRLIGLTSSAKSKQILENTEAIASSDDHKISSLALNILNQRQEQLLHGAREILMYVLFVIVVISLIFSSFGLPVWVIPMCAAIIILASGILNQRETIASMGLDIILLYVGVVTLGNAFASTEAGDMIGNAVIWLLRGSKNSYVYGAVFFLASFIMSSLIYNRAVSKILIPIALATCAALKCDPRGIMQMCYIGSMSSLIAPMSTSVVPIVMGVTGLDQKDLLKIGLPTSLMIGIITVIVGMTLYPI